MSLYRAINEQHSAAVGQAFSVAGPTVWSMLPGEILRTLLNEQFNWYKNQLVHKG